MKLSRRRPGWVGIALLVLGLTLLLTASGAIATPELIVRTSTSPERALVGEGIELRFDVLARAGWARVEIGDFEVPGALVLRTGSQGTRLDESVDGATWSGQRRVVLVFPQRAGILEIPAVPLSIDVRDVTTNAPPTTHARRVPERSLEVSRPPGAPPDDAVLATRDLVVEQTWQPEQSRPVVGDAVRRTIVRRASGTPAMVFPPFPDPPAAGVGIYPDPPRVDDATNRGRLEGRRVDSVTYVFERAGTIEVPPRRVLWWDLDAGVLRNVDVPGRKFEVRATASSTDRATASSADRATASSAEESAGTRDSWMAIALVGLVAMLLAGVSSPRLRTAADGFWQECRASEPAAFYTFVRAARTENETATLGALIAWLDRALDRPARVDVFLREFGDAQARSQIERLQAAVGGRPRAPVDSAALVRAMRRARHTWQHRRRQRRETPRELPPLNP